MFILCVYMYDSYHVLKAGFPVAQTELNSLFYILCNDVDCQDENKTKIWKDQLDL